MTSNGAACPPDSTSAPATTAPPATTSNATPTTTKCSSPSASEPPRRLRCDLSYLKTKPGILKILQILAGILGLVAAFFYAELLKPFGIIAIIAIIVTSLLLIMHLINFIEKYYVVPWLHLELFYCLIIAIALVVATILLVLEGVYPVAAFGLIAFLVYAYDAFIKSSSPSASKPPSVPVIEQATATVLTNIRVKRRLRCDLSYLKTKPGILKILQLLAGILGLVAAFFYAELLKPFGIIAIIAIIITSLLLIMYLIHFIEKYYVVPWLHLELFYCLIIAIALLVATILLILEGAYPVAAFGLIAFLVYAYDAIIKFIGVKNYAIAQGERTVVTKTTHFSGPAENVPPLTSSMINIPPIQICVSVRSKSTPDTPDLLKK